MMETFSNMGHAAHRWFTTHSGHIPFNHQMVNYPPDGGGAGMVLVGTILMAVVLLAIMAISTRNDRK